MSGGEKWFKIKIELRYLISFFIPSFYVIIGSILYRMINKKPLISVLLIALILLIINFLIVFAISLTKYRIDNGNIDIYYCGIIRQTIPASTINRIYKTENGFLIFAPADIKVRIDTDRISYITNKSYIYLSPQNIDLFIETVQYILNMKK